VADDTATGAILADGTTRCGEVFGDGGSGCQREKAGLGVVDSGACSVTGDEDEFADCWALALNVSSNETVITQCHIRIEQPRLRPCLRRALRKAEVQWRLCSWRRASLFGGFALDGSYVCWTLEEKI